MLRQLFAAALCLAPLALAAANSKGASAKDVPSWVQELSSRALPIYSGRVPAAVLLDERHVTVDPSGQIVVESRHAVKILTDAGRKQATGAAWYYTGEKPPRLRAWLVAPNGFIKAYTKRDVADVGAFAEWELYDDVRFRAVHDENPEIGSIFAYESEAEQKPLFAQDDFTFQNNLPAVESRYILTVPPGWTASGIVFNHAPIQPVVDGLTYVWELKGLRFREREPDAPEIDGLVPRLAVDFRPPAGPPGTCGQCFRTWVDISRWHTELASSQDAATPDIAAKVAELTAGAKNEYEKTRAIGRYVQQIRYVAIEMNLVHGGGYKPHAADDVFRHQYGDCKDKANLMRAMLKAAGIPSYLVALYAGDRTYVRHEWPSPTQFNHMIIAVSVADGIAGPVIDLPGVGRLLIFDPTSESTPIGDLPWFEQGSYALVCAGAKGNIIQMPVIGPDANERNVTVHATITDTADLAASVSTTLHGRAADAARELHTRYSPDEYRKSLERQLYRLAGEVTLTNFTAGDRFDDNVFNLKLAFTSHRYAQLMQQRLLVFSPSVIVPTAPELPVEPHRADPLVLRATLYRKHVSVKLPAGFTVDELPESTHGVSDFGEYSVKFAQQPGTLVMDEELRIQPVTLPAEDYSKCKQFFDRFLGADAQQTVLVKN